MALGTATVPYEPRFDTGRICLDLLSTSHPGERLDSLAPLRAWIAGSGLVPPGTELAHADPSWPAAFRELRGDVGRLVRGHLAAAGAGAGTYASGDEPRSYPSGGEPRTCAPGGDPQTYPPGGDPRPYPPGGDPHAYAPSGEPHAYPPGGDPRAYRLALARVNAAARLAPPAPRAVPGEDGVLVRVLAGPPECAALLAVVARDAVELLTDPVARGALRECAGDDCPIVYLDTSRGRRRRWCSSEVCGNRERVARHRRRTAGTAARTRTRPA
ncbi:CGNR zinc finger domain-containing protein [Streptomyces sp. NPDC014748]|uniref:CGNR zinc finger domain-containing protein n=1 Tax=Streptomyces sp. NPDC014748 TaxID=3364905 RepID=UPI0036FBB56D